MKLEKITKNMTIGEVMKKYPETADIFIKHELKCFGCFIAMMETIEQGAKSHKINLEELLKELNQAVGE